VHAAGESVEGPVPKTTHAVVLTVPDEPALWRLRTRLETTGVRFTTIVEDDAPYADQLMAIGFAPVSKEVLRKHLRMLPLLE
jgi:alpha-D-ribose 1-methylphosphonate 5-triphosphate synthase subunit PhnH